MTLPKPTIALLRCHGWQHSLLPVARTPSKLRDLLIQRGVPEFTVADNLTIVAGPATDLEPVKEALQLGQPGSGVADLMVSGIGGKILFNNPLSPTLDNPTICQDVTKRILTAIEELNGAEGSQIPKKPLLIVLSTIGISDVRRDIPLAMTPLYHWMLKAPHGDKKVMEKLIVEDTGRVLGNYVIIRPSHLTGGDGTAAGDLESIRTGVEEAPTVGYTISREDVGRWVYKYLVTKGRESEYAGKAITITY
ncbi:hypothetical protein HFD88_000432 [Aspergillus terreus]|nr:hypothetical protein HFD88_000432 [Aspergillus terreus]